MNGDLIVALVGILVGVVAFVPAIIGEAAVERFGARLRTKAERMRRAVPRVGRSVVTTLLLAAVMIVIIVVLGPVVAPGVTPWSSDKQIEESFDLSLTILKYTGLLAGGLVGLALALTAVGLVLWLLAKLLAVVRIGPRSIAGTALILTIGVSVAGYVVARSEAAGRCDRRTARSGREHGDGEVRRSWFSACRSRTTRPCAPSWPPGTPPARAPSRRRRASGAAARAPSPSSTCSAWPARRRAT